MGFELKWKRDDVVMIFKDDVEFEELTQANEIIYGSPKFDSMRYQIVDCRAVRNFNVTIEDIEVLGTLEKTATIWNNEVKIACVTTNDYVRKIFEEYAKTMQGTNWQCLLFDNYTDAEEWCKKQLTSELP